MATRHTHPRSLLDDLPQLRRNLVRVLDLKGMKEERGLLDLADLSVSHTEHDRWDGGIDFYDLVLRLPLEVFVQQEAQAEELERRLLAAVGTLFRGEERRIVSNVQILPRHESMDEPTGLQENVLPACWDADRFRLFLSHHHTAKAAAAALQGALSAVGISAFLAHEDIKPTAEWQVEIERALGTMEALLALLTPPFRESPWCNQEVGVALGRRIFVIPARMGLDPFAFIGKNQGLTLSEPWQNAAKVIARLLLDQPRTAVSMRNGLCRAFRESQSYIATQAAIGLITSLPEITDEQRALLASALESNPNVFEAHHVPEKLSALFRRLDGEGERRRQPNVSGLGRDPLSE